MKPDKRVFIVTREYFESSDTLGVFSSIKLAHEFIDNYCEAQSCCRDDMECHEYALDDNNGPVHYGPDLPKGFGAFYSSAWTPIAKVIDVTLTDNALSFTSKLLNDYTELGRH